MLIRKSGIPLMVAWCCLLALTSGSCSVSEEEGQFVCAGDADCPVGWRCDVNGDRRCYSPAGKESLWDSETSDSADTDTGTGTETSSSDSTTDSVSDTTLDTGTATEDSETEDSETGSSTGTDDTGVDTGTTTGDTETESATDIGDTGSETETADTATDTADTATDTADTATDTETADTGTDTETVTDLNSCTGPVAITMYNDAWHGKWTEQGAAFFPAEPNECGEGGGRDVWFLLTIPAGETITILETTDSEVVLRTVADCDATDCLDAAAQPERLRITNSFGAPMDFYLIVSEDPTNTVDDFTVTFTM